MWLGRESASVQGIRTLCQACLPILALRSHRDLCRRIDLSGEIKNDSDARPPAARRSPLADLRSSERQPRSPFAALLTYVPRTPHVRSAART